MEQMFNVTHYSLTAMSSALIIFNILLTFVLCLAVMWVYRATHKGLSYSQSYAHSLIMMAVLASVAMMILGNNLTRALGILGVFTLIRFRTIIKDPKDATFLFFALSIGLATGTRNYAIALLLTILLSLIVYVLHHFNVGSVARGSYLLTLVVGSAYQAQAHEELFEQHVLRYKTLQIRTLPDGDREYYFGIRFPRNIQPDQLVGSLQSLQDVKTVDLMNGREATEY